MNKEETLALYAQGRDAWNKWAEEMLARRKALEERGEWETGKEAWIGEARADLSHHQFAQETNFHNFVFPDFADFSETTFNFHALFHDVIFEGGVSFDNTSFNGKASFDRVSFNGNASFNNVAFNGSAEFWDAKFKETAQFKDTKFNSVSFIHTIFADITWFENAIFRRIVAFMTAEFKTLTSFRNTTFHGKARFDRTIFAGEARFGDATFNDYAGFECATFQGMAEFQGTDFNHLSTFTMTWFEQAADFSAIQVNRAFTLAGAEFKKVPDFTQAHFAEAPLLDDIQVPLNERGASVRYRSLKRLAIQGHDHVNELNFFAAELKAVGGIRRPLVFLYELVSNFGRSIGMPIVWWLIGLSAFADAYLAWAGEACANGAGTPIGAAFLLSFHRALPPTGLGNETKLKEVHACLYGEHIPDAVALLGVLQSVISLVLIFLVLLAIRNHFRIR